jgi:hypothetical protein
MTVSQTTVTGPIYTPGITSPENAKIVFELSSWDKEIGEAVFVTGPYTSDIDSSGDFSVDLFTSGEGENGVVYNVYVQYLSNFGEYKYEFIGTVSLSGAGPYNLADLEFVDPMTTRSFDLLAEVAAYKTEVEAIVSGIDTDIIAIDQAVIDAEQAVTDATAQVALAAAEVILAQAEVALAAGHASDASDYADAAAISAAAATGAGYRAISDITSGDNITTSDTGKLIDILTGTGTLTFDAAATLTSASSVTIRNSGTGVLTLDPNGSETINGSATLRLYQGDIVRVFCDGSNLFSVFTSSPQLITIATGSINSGSNVNLVTDLDQNFANIYVDLTGVSISSSTRRPLIQLGTGAGPTFDTTAANYLGISTTEGELADTLGDASIVATFDEAASASWNIYIEITGHQAGSRTRAYSVNRVVGDYVSISQMVYLPTDAITAIRGIVAGGSGNFDGSGTFAVYGKR